MRRIFLLVVASLALAMPGLAQQWTEYRPASGVFRVEFPGTPTESSKTLPNGQALQSAGFNPGDGTFLTVVTSPVSPQSAAKPMQELLDILRDSQLRATNGMLREEQTVTVGSSTGRRVIIDTPAGIEFYTQILPKGDRLYQVTYAAPRGAEKPQDVKRFLDSFKLLKD